MTELKQAVRLSEEYLAALIPEADAVLLEEVEKQGDAWFVTLSFVLSKVGSGIQLAPERRYKQFRISGGKVTSMKIRELSGA